MACLPAVAVRAHFASSSSAGASTPFSSTRGIGFSLGSHGLEFRATALVSTLRATSVRVLFSTHYKLPFSQLPCFHNHLRCRRCGSFRNFFPPVLGTCHSPLPPAVSYPSLCSVFTTPFVCFQLLTASFVQTPRVPPCFSTAFLLSLFHASLATNVFNNLRTPCHRFLRSIFYFQWLTHSFCKYWGHCPLFAL